MLKTSQKILALISIVSGAYMLVSQNYEIIPYTTFALASLILLTGISEIKKARKKMGLIDIAVSLLLFFLAVYVLLNKAL